MSQLTSGLSADTLLGDPAGLAEYQFRLAGELCGSCRTYHALWPYRRLANMVAGVEGSFEMLRLLLRASTPPDGRVLIAGCADAGMLALTSKALEGIPCSIEVADRCLTPLAVCRHYADDHGLAIATHETDLGREQLPKKYDVVLGHGSLRFVPRPDRAAFLGSVAGMLAPGGTLLQAEPHSIETRGNPFADYAEEMVSALREQGVALPEAEERFRARIESNIGALSKRMSEALGPRELAITIEQAGLVLRVAAEYELQSTDMAPSPRLMKFGMQIAVALPPGSSL